MGDNRQARKVKAAKARHGFPEGDPAGVLMDGLRPERLTRIVDVGANPLSDPPYKPMLDAGACDLWGFEPQKEAFEKLKEASSENETYLPYAVGDGEKHHLHVYRDSGLTSLYPPYEPTLSFLGRSRRNISLVERIPMQTRRLDAMEALPEFDLLKIDAQGAEVAVFQGAERKMQAATVVITEVRFFPLYDGEPMLGGVDVELRRQGFYLHKLLFTKAKVLPNSQMERLKLRAHRNQLIDGDAVYLRNMAEPEAHSDEQLRHLALLASSVCASHDLALRCLDLLVARGAVDSGLPDAYVSSLPNDVLKD